MALKELKSHETDFLLVREQIKAWEKVVLRQKDKEKGDTFLFSVMVELVKQFGTKDPEWNCVIEQFINTLFAVKQLKSYKKVELLLHSLMKKLSSEQDNIIEQIENEIRDREEIDIDETLFDCNLKFNENMLAQLIFVAGHIGMKMVIFIENIEKLLEKRNEKKKQKKKESKKSEAHDEEAEEELDLIAGGNDADLENDRTFLTNVLNKTLLQKNILAKFVPIIDEIIKNMIEKYSRVESESSTFLEKTVTVSFCKFMLVSSDYCENKIDILFQLLSIKGLDCKIKSNILICIGDLYKRFPTILDSYHDKFILNLNCDNNYVRRNCLRVISHLALNDMIKIRGEISDICKLLKDSDENIRDLVKLFLHELHSKHNDTIYNLIPEAINRLSECHHFSAEDFEEIAKILSKYVEKDKQIEMLLDKLLQKLSNSTNENEVRNTAYTISILNLTEKHLPKLMEHYDKYKVKIQQNEGVRNIFKTIPAKFKKNNDIKELIDTMEAKFSIDVTSQLPLASETKVVAEMFNDLKKKRGKKAMIMNQSSQLSSQLKQPDQNVDQSNMQVDDEEQIVQVKRRRKLHERSDDDDI